MNSFEQKFAKTRPFLWHLTAAKNIDRIIEMNRLDCAATILRDAGRNELIRKPRCEDKDDLTHRVNGETVIVRDQAPLCHHKKVQWTHDGWTLKDYVKYLNGFVFFFPGTEKGPVKRSEGFVKIYKQQQALCIPTEDLFMANQGTPPQFSCCNSGAPSLRLNCPRRGPDIFVCGKKFEDKGKGKGIPSKVVEVAFRCRVDLPDPLEVFGYDCRKEQFFLITNRS